MKRENPTARELLILASVKAEMQKPRLTESVREGEREEAEGGKAECNLRILLGNSNEATSTNTTQTALNHFSKNLEPCGQRFISTVAPYNCRGARGLRLSYGAY